MREVAAGCGGEITADPQPSPEGWKDGLTPEAARGERQSVEGGVTSHIKWTELLTVN